MKSVIVTASVHHGKNIPNKNEQWKAPVKDWIRNMYEDRFHKSSKKKPDETDILKLFN